MSQAVVKSGSHALRRVFARSEVLSRLLAMSRESEHLEISGLSGSANSFVIAELLDRLKETIVVITPTEKLATALCGDLQELCGEGTTFLFPSWGIYHYDWLVPPQENLSQRLETLWNLLTKKQIIVVTTPTALTEKTIPREQLEKSCFELNIGEEYNLTDIAARLVAMGYERTAMTEEVGTFSIRGGILDVFPFTSVNPVRCEFFGDFIDSMRYFNVLTQRSVDPADEITLIPRREILISNSDLESRIDRLDLKTAEYLREKCLAGFDNPGLEWVAAMLEIPRESLFEYFPENTRLFFHDYESIKQRLTEDFGAAQLAHRQLAESFERSPLPEQVYTPEDIILGKFEQICSIREKPLGSSKDGISFGAKDHPAFGGQVSLLRESLNAELQQGRQIYILSDNELQKERLAELLAEFEGRVNFVVSELHQGFQMPEIGAVFLTDHQIFERYFARHRRKRFKEGVAISSYQALEIGDYVVHEDYGIGRYRGLKAISVSQRQRECLLIYYAEDDKLYVPIEEFGRVRKYVGKEGAPQLTRLGGKNWDKVKARTKKAIADMAGELIALYAARKSRPGFAFGSDDDWMKQLEASFPYEETPDQLSSIVAMKKDMEQATPMDRLICGDVGFGKTEVAIRGALKAIAAGKQVAVLVPTTILAQQHLSTFKRRLAPFPVRIEMLSRFRSRAEQKQTVTDLATGGVDVVIGTHRLLQKDIQIPNLGLIVVDEEQRFGVANKEKLKQLRQLADCITLTATPIPRTLQLSLFGARDMSLINTSPKERQPIVTEIAEFDPKIIYEAINFEIMRKGQVYFVHNRVETILSMYRYLTKLLSHVRIAVAHGQMPEHELEDVMLGFLNRDYDILLTSAIIESGIDIASVNTIIINRADKFGLAQLYQLRGRVGRSQERAYAYLLIPPIKQLTDTARKRLKAIEQHTELGSGFHLAMKDLEIRGAGNLLGPQQHGFIEEVGFDLYCRLLEEAVAELKGETRASEFEVKLEIDCDSLIPSSYVEDSSQRVEIYRKISVATATTDLEAVSAEMIDRFGQYGEEVENLLDIMAIKILAQERRISRVKLLDLQLTLSYGDGSLPTKKQIEQLRLSAPEKIEFDSSDGFVIKITFPQQTLQPVREAKKLLPLL